MTGHSRKIERHSTARHQVSLLLARCLSGQLPLATPAAPQSAGRPCMTGFTCAQGRVHA